MRSRARARGHKSYGARQRTTNASDGKRANETTLIPKVVRNTYLRYCVRDFVCSVCSLLLRPTRALWPLCVPRNLTSASCDSSALPCSSLRPPPPPPPPIERLTCGLSSWRPTRRLPPDRSESNKARAHLRLGSARGSGSKRETGPPCEPQPQCRRRVGRAQGAIYDFLRLLFASGPHRTAQLVPSADLKLACHLQLATSAASSSRARGEGVVDRRLLGAGPNSGAGRLKLSRRL